MPTPAAAPTPRRRGRGAPRARYLPALVLAVCIAASLAPAGASAASVDESSAKAGLRDLRTYFRAVAVTNLSASTQSVETFVRSTGAGCPNVLAAAALLPKSAIDEGAAEAFGEETGADVGLAFIAPDKAATTTLGTQLSKLRWSSRTQTRKVRTALAARGAYVRLPLSDLCEDASAAAAVEFKSTPAGTLQFLAALGRTNGEAYLTLIAGAHGFSATRADRRVVSEIKRLEGIVESTAKGLVQTEAQNLLKALGLPA